jgi:hypothetical protein
MLKMLSSNTRQKMTELKMMMMVGLMLMMARLLMM